MGGPERSSSSYQSSRHRTRSKSPRERERYRDRERKDRDRERDYYSSRHKSKIKSISKHSRKSKYHRRSSSSNSSDDSSNSSSRSSRIRAPSSESNSRSAPTTSSSNTSTVTKGLDLMDFKVQKTLNAIEEDSFKQKTFFSTKDREAPEKFDKVIIDLNAETVTFPKHLELPGESVVKEEIFHPNFLGDQEQKQDKWIRKLLMYRQKYMSE